MANPQPAGVPMAVVHFARPPRPGEQPAGPASTPMGGDVSRLPAALARDMAPPGTRVVPACNPAIPIGPQHVMSGVACMVNCVRCRKTPEWIACPENGHQPKDPEKGWGRGIEEFTDADHPSNQLSAPPVEAPQG